MSLASETNINEPQCSWMFVWQKSPVYLSFNTSGINTSGKNHFHEMNGDVGMAGWK